MARGPGRQKKNGPVTLLSNDDEEQDTLGPIGAGDNGKEAPPGGKTAQGAVAGAQPSVPGQTPAAPTPAEAPAVATDVVAEMRDMANRVRSELDATFSAERDMRDKADQESNAKDQADQTGLSGVQDAEQGGSTGQAEAGTSAGQPDADQSGASGVFHGGGVVKRTGTAKVKKGETVLSKPASSILGRGPLMKANAAAMAGASRRQVLNILAGR